jgi:long-chain acyl-CoA synthetase
VDVEKDSLLQSHQFAPTLPSLLLRYSDNFRKADAFMVKENDRWVGISSADFLLAVEELFFGLRPLGICAGDRVVILSENRIEWAFADFAIAASGAISIPIYPTSTAAQVQYILRNSGASIVFVSTGTQLDKIEAVRAAAPSVRYVIVFDQTVHRPGAIRLEAVLRLGRSIAYEAPRDFRHAALSVEPGNMATIIYTSGTTGLPKGVMLTHRNLISNVLATSELLPLTADDLELSFLPLSHIFQRHVDYAALYSGSSIAYSEDLNQVVGDMAEVRPTFAAAVPRFFEKIHDRMLAAISMRSIVHQRLFRLALSARPGSALWRLVDGLVFGRIRAQFGGRMRWFISGGAPLDPMIAEFFHRVGLPIVEGYGMTEASPVITFSAPGRERIGRAGYPIRGVEVRIAHDGEILVRGPNVMAGYYNLAQETQRALRGGWLHTGDIGRFDEAGYVEITGRKKDLIITSTGQNIAPQLLESRLQRIPYFEHAIVVGDGRSFITALVSPNYDALMRYARTHGIPFIHPSELLRKREIYDMAMHEIRSCTEDLADYEQIKRIAFLEGPLSIAAGDLTPTFKVRRDEIVRKYSAEIDALYAA